MPTCMQSVFEIKVKKIGDGGQAEVREMTMKVAVKSAKPSWDPEVH